MELRMRIWIGTELEQKASAADLALLKAEFAAKAAVMESMMPLRDQYISQLKKVVEWRDSAQAGHFTDAQEAKMAETAKKVLAAQEDEGWTRRERLFAAVAILSTVVVSGLNVAQASGVL
jgi:hypothetical protein